MRLIVTDANVLIDLEAGGLLEDIFRLEQHQFTVPNVLYIEELADSMGHLPGLGLAVLSLNPEQVAAAEALRAKYRRASMNDLFALVLAQSERTILLSGDGALRDAAAEVGVEVHGTIWLMEQLHDVLGIHVDRLADAYKQMEQAGSRLPWTEVDKQLARWRS